MNLPQIFNYDNQQIRTVDEAGEILFVASDLCAILGINATQIRRLDAEEKGMRLMQTPSGMQEMAVVNESGLYALVLGCRKPEAKQFKKWVTSDVLPAIRKTGGYSVAVPSIADMFRISLQAFEEADRKASLALTVANEATEALHLQSDRIDALTPRMTASSILRLTGTINHSAKLHRAAQKTKHNHLTVAVSTGHFYSLILEMFHVADINYITDVNRATKMLREEDRKNQAIIDEHEERNNLFSPQH